MASCLNLHAQTVSPEAARAKAMDFFSTGAKNLPARKGAMRKAPAVSNVELAYTSEKDGKTCFYVYNNGTDGGFVIVGGDEVAQEILAYSDYGHFDYDKAPDNFKDMLSQYTEQISLAKPVAKSQPAKSPAKVAAATVQKEDIPDLIETTWNQLDPYNRAISKLVNSNTGEEFTPPTGCVPTAAAQIMKYWNYPEHGVGQETYVLDYSEIDGPSAGDPSITPELGVMVHDVDFEGTTYDWANMLNNYSGEETDEQIDAVSTLMYHVGVACHVIYGPNQTGGSFPEQAMIKYFGYNPKASRLFRQDWDDQIWEEIIYTEIKLGNPVLYEGRNQDDGGHVYIIHGYSSEYDMYKVNWGWGGFLDCYCKLTPVSEGVGSLMGYEYSQKAVINLKPTSLNSNEALDYGFTFWVDGIKYSVISDVFKTVEVTRPDASEIQYSGLINIPANVNFQGANYSVIGIGKEAFHIRSITNGLNPLDSPIEGVEFSNNLRYIQEGAFRYCGNIETITIPNSVNRISYDAFSSCKSLRIVYLSDNITSLNNIFPYCDNLAVLSLPKSLRTLHRGILNGCGQLNVLLCDVNTPPTLIGNPFPPSARSGYLLVPEESIDKYRDSSYWKEWKHILPIENTDITMFGKIVSQNGIEYKIMPGSAEVCKVLTSATKITIPDSIVINGQEYVVESVGPRAFEDVTCDSIVLPQHLESIKPYTFYFCTAKSISIPNSVVEIDSWAFYGCNNIEKLCIPDAVEYIPEDCFYDCEKLLLVELPKNLKEINYSAFRSCRNLYTIVCKSQEVPVWDNELQNLAGFFEGTLYVPNISLQKYKSAAYWKDWRFIKPLETFEDNEELNLLEMGGFEYRILNHGAVIMSLTDYSKTDYNIPDAINYKGKSYDIVSIGEGVFLYSPITSVRFPSSLHSISASSFSGRSGLSNIDFPESLKCIGYGAFSGCSGISSLSLPNGVNNISNDAFAGCTNLQDFNFPDSLKVMNDIFGGTAIPKLLIPEGVDSIATISYYMDSLVEVVYPSTARLDINKSLNFGEVEKVYALSPDFPKISDIYSPHTTIYVPSEYLDACKNKFLAYDWRIKDLLPITPLTSIAMNRDTLAMKTGETGSLSTESSPADASLKYVKWSSSDPAIASVDQNGVVTARKSGTVTITATGMYYPDVTATCTVTVKAGTVGTLVDAIDGLPSGRTTLKDVDDAVDSILER